MGYRSDVKAVFYAPAEKAAALKLYVDENFPTVGDLSKDEDLTWCERKHYCGYLLENESVKWYDSYVEIQAFNRFVSNFLELAEGENDLAWAYEFIRVGEDYEDIEVNRSDRANFVLDVSRSIDVNF